MVIVIIYLEEMYIKIKYSVFILAVWYSQSSSMVNVFGDSIASGPGNLQVAKKVVATVGQYKEYSDEIQQSYELGFTPYRLHKNVDGVFVTPILVYEGRVYVLDDVATMEVGDRYLETDTINSKLVYFVKGDGGGGGDIVALEGDRGTAGA